MNSVMLPGDPISKGQPWAAKRLVEPDPEVVQGCPSGQPGLEAIQGMGALVVRAEGRV